MSTLFWIGTVLFVLGTAARMYAANKIRSFKSRIITIGELSVKTAPYRQALHMFSVMSLSGLTMILFGV
ncbi:MAG: hypothetical protein K2O88_04905 [Paramuribaculum sp.]|nr:hypothetical protein [Paramuribaculum sp.]